MLINVDINCKNKKKTQHTQSISFHCHQTDWRPNLFCVVQCPMEGIHVYALNCVLLPVAGGFCIFFFKVQLTPIVQTLVR